MSSTIKSPFVNQDKWASYLQNGRDWYQQMKDDPAYIERNKEQVKRWLKYKREDTKFKCQEYLRTFISSAIRQDGKNRTWKYVGCEAQSYRKYLECLFTSEMNWDNYKTVWIVDYVVPLDFFDLSIEENIYKAYSYLNTEPKLIIK